MKLKLKHVLLVLALSICTPNFSTAQVDLNDSLALVDLYNSTDGPHWKNNSGWLSGPIQNWYGITVYLNRVFQILLPGNNLKGKMPSSLGNLTNLYGCLLY